MYQKDLFSRRLKFYKLPDTQIWEQLMLEETRDWESIYHQFKDVLSRYIEVVLKASLENLSAQKEVAELQQNFFWEEECTAEWEIDVYTSSCQVEYDSFEDLKEAHIGIQPSISAEDALDSSGSSLNLEWGQISDLDVSIYELQLK